MAEATSTPASPITWEHYPPHPRLIAPPVLPSRHRPGFRYSPTTSPLESLFPHNPVLTNLLRYLTTPALVNLYASCRTFRFYLRGQRRFFRNLILVPDEQAECWQPFDRQAGANQIHSASDPELQWNSSLKRFISEHSMYVNEHDRKMLQQGHFWALVKGDPAMAWELETSEVDWVCAITRPRKKKRRYFDKLMSRHVYAMLKSFPIGRRLTTLVLDGTGVDTDFMTITVQQLEGTMKGLSVKNCPNLECYMWAEWLLNILDEARPFALKWLHIWGSGNTPTTDFDSSHHPLPLTPIDPDPDDPEEFTSGDYDIPFPRRPDLFTNLIPINFHMSTTLHLIPPMTHTLTERHAYMTALRGIIANQYTRLRDPRTLHWHAPSFPIGDPHPLIALMTVAKFMSITTDVAFCASGRDCYSFIQGRPYYQNINRPMRPQEIEVTVCHNATGITMPLTLTANSDDPIELHTHAVAEVGARREAGGTICQNCGLWEDELSPEEYRGQGGTREYGGVTWGTGLGLGRMAIGDVCIDCRSEMTCVGCNSFYCQCCVHRSILHPLLPNNDIANEPPGTIFLHWTCPKNLHGPYCDDCMQAGKHFLKCDDCDGDTCIGCHGVSGCTVSSALYTRDGWDEEDEKERYGLLGNVDEWEIGHYKGWGGDPEDRLPKDRSDSEEQHGEDENESGMDVDYDSDADTSLPGPDVPGPNQPGVTSSPPPSSDGDEMDPDYWRRDLDRLTSENNLPSTPGFRSDPFFDSDPATPTNPAADLAYAHLPDQVSVPHSATHSELDRAWAHRLQRICETRIFERCASCGVGRCAGCLGYEEDLIQLVDGVPQPVDEGGVMREPEFRWCSGGCQKRFCSDCVDAFDEIVCSGTMVADSDNDGDDEELPDAGASGVLAKGKKKMPVRVRCGKVMCRPCQETELIFRPTIAQGEEGVEVEGGHGFGDENNWETEQRFDDHRGSWRCTQCAIGFPLAPF